MYVVALVWFHNQGKYLKYETCVKLNENIFDGENHQKINEKGKVCTICAFILRYYTANDRAVVYPGKKTIFVG